MNYTNFSGPTWGALNGENGYFTSVAIYMPMARELLPGMGEQTLKDEVKMGGALNKPVLFISNTSEETKITRLNGKMKKATILIYREQLPEDVLSQLDCSKMLQCACN